MYAILILSQSSKTMHLNSAHQSMKSCVRCLRCTSAYLADIFPVLHNPTSCNNCIILWNSIKRKEPLMKILVFDIGGTRSVHLTAYSFSQSQSFSHRIIKSLKSRFFHAPPSISYKKTRHFHDFYDEHSPYASCDTSNFGYFSNF